MTRNEIEEITAYALKLKCDMLCKSKKSKIKMKKLAKSNPHYRYLGLGISVNWPTSTQCISHRKKIILSTSKG